MGNKRLKKREHSLKGLGRRGLSLLMAMVMTLSLVQISAFATDGEEKNPLDPTPDGITDSNGVKIRKSAERFADDEWKVTVEATVGEKPIQQQPLEVVFVLDRSGSMNWCAEESHVDNYSHQHGRKCGWGKIGNKHDNGHLDDCYTECTKWSHWEVTWDGLQHKEGTSCEERDGKYYFVDEEKCPDYGYTCGQEEVIHRGAGSGNEYCQHRVNGKWVKYPNRLSAAKTAVDDLVGSLPDGAIVKYVSFAGGASLDKDGYTNIKAEGGTYIMKGVKKGISQFSESKTSKKILILVTDGVESSDGYTSSELTNFSGTVYTIGFAADNQNLAGMTKNGGTYMYAKNSNTLKNVFADLKTTIAAMIVDPMGDKVSYQNDAADVEGSVEGSFTTVGNTLYWLPKNVEKINPGETIKYTYTVKLNGNASREAGDYTKAPDNVPLNGETYLQYGIEKGDKKEACKTEYEVPVGSYKVSTLTESFEDTDGKTINEATPHPEQHEITDFRENSSLTVYGAPQSIATNDPHERYVYQYSKLNDERINEGDADVNGSYATFADYGMGVYDQTTAYELVHVYKLEYVNSVTYEYTGEVPEDLNAENEDMLGTQWYPKDSIQTKADEPTSDKYNFSGWTVKSGNVEFKENGTFDLTDDVVFEGSWSIKPSYQVEAYYYTCVDGKSKAEPDNKDAISLTGTVYVDEDGNVQYAIQSGDYTKYDGKTVYDYEVAVAPGSTGKLEKGSEVVTDITPSQETTTVTLYFYHNTKTAVEYTVTHEYYNVDPDNNETLVDANTAVDTYRGEHEETIQAADVSAKKVDTYTETGRSPESIQLNKNAEATPNITITYKHYEYRVTVTGGAGVTAINGDGFKYSKGKNGSVNFKLKPGYKLASVTDQAGTDEPKAVTASADVNGVYSYSIRNIQANHHVYIKTEQIPYTLTVKYEFSDKSTHNGFDPIVKNDYFYGQAYKAEQKAAPAGYHFVGVTGDPAEGKITKNTEVTFHYEKNGNGTVIVNYLKEGTVEQLLGSKSASGTIGTAYNLSSTACGEQYVVKSITKDNVVYDLVSEPNMTGTFQEKFVIDLYYKERDKNSVVVKYQSESNDPKFVLDADVMEKTYTDYVGKNYNVSGSEYVPETIVDKAGNTWYRSGVNSDVNYDKLTGVIGKLEDSQPTATVIIKYYLKPTYSITATYTTVTDGTPSSDSRSSGKQTGDVDAAVPFNRADYDNYSGFTFNDFVSNSLKVNNTTVSEMPKMEKFQNYDVTLEYRKTVNNPKATTLNHVFFTVLDNGPETKDEDKTLTETIQVTYGKSANMEEYAKKGAGYEGYNAERYSHKDKMLPAGANGTIEYVRHMVTVVFDLKGGTWKNSQDDVNYTVVKNTGLNDQQPVPQPTRDGYDFVRWVAQPDNAVTTGKFDQRTVFTAQWTPKKPVVVSYFYTVTYNYTVTTDGTVTYQDSETTQVQDTTKASQTINASATASHGGYTFDLASPAEQTADLTGTTREAPHQFVVNYVLTVNNGGGGRDDRDDDRPAPKPTPDTEIKDDDVPKTDLPEQPVEIPDEETPKADLPQAPVDIPDEDTPKADVPKTGDAMGLWVMAAVASGAGLVWLNLTGKKRKDDNG